MEEGLYGPVSQSVTLDGSGRGAVQFQATNKPLRITNWSVIASSNVLEATATVYKNQIGAMYRLSGTFSGSSGDNNNDEVVLTQGQSVFIVWEGGDPGAIATATVSGYWDVPNRGFRAVG